MKNMYLCIVMLFVGNLCFSQQHSNGLNSLQVKKYDAYGQMVSHDTYESEQAKTMNFEQIINNHPEGQRVSLFGYYTKEDIRHFVFYSGSKSEAQLCQKETLVFKPFLGVSGSSNENFTGIILKSVAEESPASQLGLIAGDVIYSLGDHAITSYCDLQMAVRSAEVGQTLNLEYSKSGSIKNADVVIAGKPTIRVTFENCEQAPVQFEEIVELTNVTEEVIEPSLSVFPNPTKEISYLRYESPSNEPLAFYILDSKGSLVYKEDIENFHGSLRTSFTFSDQVPGTYYFVIDQGETKQKSKVLFLGR